MNKTTNNEYVNAAIRTTKRRLGYDTVAYKLNRNSRTNELWVSLMVQDGNTLSKCHIKAGMSSIHTPALEGELGWSDYLIVGLHSAFNKIPEGYIAI